MVLAFFASSDGIVLENLAHRYVDWNWIDGDAGWFQLVRVYA